MKRILYFLLFCCLLHSNCSSNNIVDTAPLEEEEIIVTETEAENSYKILSLGDSYTIGQSVCETCKFPVQLKDSLRQRFTSNTIFELKVIAQTGWTTTNLINSINTQNPANSYDLVTLLIGVNNQYQGKPFSLYESEFPQLVNKAISKAKGNKSNVIVISIPDYAFTPFGNGNLNISKDIDLYNTFAKNYCDATNISFVNITDITRMGLIQTGLVAQDGLHPSELAYSKFVQRLSPIAFNKLKD